MGLRPGLRGQKMNNDQNKNIDGVKRAGKKFGAGN